MRCPRLDHFVRLNHTGKFGKCGHMTRSQEFDSLDDMQQSVWLKKIKKNMQDGVWPKECVRCQLTEETSNTSIRLDMIERDRILKSIQKNYLIVGGVLDNICNSACQSCNAELSTKIGSLENKNYKKINNYDNFFKLPQDRIVEVDVNGGEPTASPNYKRLLKNLPEATKIVRINTNGSRVISEIEELLKKNMRIIVTLSFDGTGNVHDYARWPILWKDYIKSVAKYVQLRKEYKTLRINFWTTVSCLNVGDLKNIVDYAKKADIDHAYGFCIRPSVLDIRHVNVLTTTAKAKLLSENNTLLSAIANKCASFNVENSIELENFINTQDALRKIYFKDYFNFALNFSKNNLANT
jgi:sulfatase maturation enzyme AslB (radical SAM superfamily)